MTEEKLVKLLDMALEKITELEEEIHRGDDYTSALDGENDDLNEKVLELQDENIELIEALNSLKEMNINLEAMNESLYERIRKLEEENARKDKALADLSSGLEVQEAAIFELKDHNERLINSKGESKPKWIDILDATKRPKANEQVLITTKIGKVTIACFDEDGKVHTQIGNKAVQALAWMPMPKAYDTERA